MTTEQQSQCIFSFHYSKVITEVASHRYSHENTHLQNSTKFTWKCLHQGLTFNKTKIETIAHVFPCEFYENFRRFLQNVSRGAT